MSSGRFRGSSKVLNSQSAVPLSIHKSDLEDDSKEPPSQLENQFLSFKRYSNLSLYNESEVH